MAIERIRQSIEAVQAFNEAVTLTRMFPALAPQVKAGVDRALHIIKHLAGSQGAIHFGMQNGVPVVSGEQVAGYEKEELQDLVVFKQLTLLSLEHVVFSSTLDDELLKKIIFVFTARKEKIAREGGGRSFVDNQGLNSIFPETFSQQDYVQTNEPKVVSSAEPPSFSAPATERARPEVVQEASPQLSKELSSEPAASSHEEQPEVIEPQLEDNLFEGEEIIVKVPREVKSLLDSNQPAAVLLIVKRLVSEINQKDTSKAYSMMSTLCLVGEILVKAEQYDLLQELVEPLLKWVHQSDSGDFIYEKVLNILHAVSNTSLKEGNIEVAQNVLFLLKDIRTGKLKKSPPVKALVGRIQDKCVDNKILGLLLEEYLKSAEDSKVAPLILAHGVAGSNYLITRLVESEEGAERMSLLELLSEVEENLPSVILKKLEEPLPWYGKRNLLKLLALKGKKEHSSNIVEYLADPDLRVQREAFICLYKTSGSNLKKHMVEGLPLANETIKFQIVKVLLTMGDDMVAKGLVELLHEYSDFSDENRDKLFTLICQALVNCKSKVGQQWLNTFLRKAKNGEAVPTDSVLKTAEQALLELNLELGEESTIQIQSKGHTEEQSLLQEETPASVEKTVNAINPEITSPKKEAASDEKKPSETSITFSAEEKKIRELFKSGDEGNAKALLVDFIIAHAKKRKFDHADQLRELLIESSPMSLAEIIHTAEIIEEEKSNAIDRGHLEVWTELYDALSTEEFSTLYHSMQHRKYNREEVMIRQHDSLSALFFVNSGKVKLFYSDGSAEILVKVAGAGDILGVDSFFNASVWTINASTMGRADVSMLRLDRLQKWKEEYPALESKLYDYCLRFESLRDYFKHTAKDRRDDERVTASGRVASVLLDKKGQPTNIGSKGELADISRGGAAFFMRISKKENARILLGQGIRLHLPAAETVGKVIAANGRIVAVRAHLAMENEFSVHVEFSSKLNKTDIQKICRASKE